MLSTTECRRKSVAVYGARFHVTTSALGLPGETF